MTPRRQRKSYFKDVEELRGKGPKPEFEAIAAELDGAVTEKRKSATK